MVATYLPLLAMGSKCPGNRNRSNRRAPDGTHSHRRQGKTRNRMAANNLSGKTRRKPGPGIRNLRLVPRRLNTKIIPAAARITAPAPMVTTGQR
jgi:hypothetical protein